MSVFSGFAKWKNNTNPINLVLALAENPEIRARVEKASIPAYKAMLVAGGDIPPQKRQTLIDEYITLCKRYNMSHAAEQQTADAYFEELRAQ